MLNMKDNIELFLCLFVLSISFMYGGFFIGRRYESKFWTKYYKEEMNKLCLECAGLAKGGGYDGTPN